MSINLTSLLLNMEASRPEDTFVAIFDGKAYEVCAHGYINAYLEATKHYFGDSSKKMEMFENWMWDIRSEIDENFDRETIPSAEVLDEMYEIVVDADDVGDIQIMRTHPTLEI